MNGRQIINSRVNAIKIIKAINIIKESDISLIERRIVFEVDFFLFSKQNERIPWERYQKDSPFYCKKV